MKTLSEDFPPAAVLEMPNRRRVIAGLGAGAVMALAGGCAAPTLAPRTVVKDRAPRIGATFTYGYRSGWSNVAPRTLAYKVVSVSEQGIQDSLGEPGSPGSGGDRFFASIWEIADRPLTNLMVHEFSPYLLAFGDPPIGERVEVSVPPATWGTTWTTTAHAVGSERVSTPAGSFDAVRVEIVGTRLFVSGQMDSTSDPVRMYATAWLAPAVKRSVRFIFQTQAEQLNLLSRDHYELQSYQAG
jgi:hypothetical protein